MSDFDETVWQHVLDEASQELLGRKRDALATLGAKGDAAFVHADQSMITDAGAVGVLAQVAQDLFGATEGSLGVHHPVDSIESVEQLRERFRIDWGLTRNPVASAARPF